MDSEYPEYFFIMLFLVLIGILIGAILSYEEINIQDVKQINDEYYITINNEIYYKEVG